jgi:hypothetical protein
MLGYDVFSIPDAKGAKVAQKTQKRKTEIKGLGYFEATTFNDAEW